MTLAAAGLVVTFGAPTLVIDLASAQSAKKPNRDTAMQRCISFAQKQFPEVNTEQAGRVAAYKACMTKAGHRP